MTLQQVKDGLIYLVVHGSRAYGVNTPSSDWDIKGICIPPEEYYFSFHKHFEQYIAGQELIKLLPPGKRETITEPLEGTVYDIRKFFKLTAACNPNMIDMLFVPDRLVLYISPEGRELRKHARLFLSKKARYTFTGYAHAQLQRIKNHRERLLNPPQKPERTKYASEEAYKNALKKYTSYQKWRASRNPARAALEERFKYDTKHAMHLIRLLRMGLEILRDNTVSVFRNDFQDLLDIRNGAWTYEHLVEYAQKLDKLVAEAYNTSKLPYNPPVAKLDELCTQLIKRHLYEN